MFVLARKLLRVYLPYWIFFFFFFFFPSPPPFLFSGLDGVVKAFGGGYGVVLELWCILLFARWMGGSRLKYINLALGGGVNEGRES